MSDDLTLEEIDEILLELENSFDSKSRQGGVNVFEITEAKRGSPVADNSVLRFECPTELWEEFSEYCKRNELDPAQQIREAIIAYYKNLWETYKIRRKHFDKSELV